ncbi:MAG: hypothetical protein JSU73_13980 [candidate division WOR-3 bacterium]|nr:MAG: hypothetical protein JSU73_13980 [candidate division WOR-3 bacterium]
MAETPKYEPPKAVRLRDAETAQGDAARNTQPELMGVCWETGNSPIY